MEVVFIHFLQFLLCVLKDTLYRILYQHRNEHDEIGYDAVQGFRSAADDYYYC